MLTITHGDLFTYAAPGSMIVHGCNAQGKMGSGFAREIRNRFPKAYLAYWNAYQSQHPLELGSYVSVYTRGYCIFNAITQLHYGRAQQQYVDYDAVRKALQHACEQAIRDEIPVHLPLIGGGHGRGDKDTLIALIAAAFKHVDATLYLPQEHESWQTPTPTNP